MSSIPAGEDWLADMLRNIGEAIIATDEQSHISWMNAAAESFTGFVLADARGRSLVDVLALYDGKTGLPAVSPVYRLFSETASRLPSAAYILRDGRGREQDVEISCFRNGPSRAILSCRDLTDQRKTWNRSIQVARLDAIASLACALAQDLNQHVSAVLGRTEALRRSAGDAAQTTIVEIKKAAKGAAAILSILEKIGRCAVSDQEVLVLSDTVANMRAAIERSLGEKFTLQIAEDPVKAKVLAGADQVKHVILALAAHAHERMPNGGEFRIQIGRAEILEETEAIPHDRVGSYARLRISDSGGGLAPQALQHVFEPSCTSRPVDFVNHVGLSAAHGILTQCGGFTQAKSTPGVGTTFDIFLPRVYRFQGEPGDAGTPDDAPVTVLLVEDDDLIRRLLHNYMERVGLNLLEASNAEEAIDVEEVYDGTIHVLVTDIILPGISGHELAAKLLAVRPEMKILLVSANPANALNPTGPEPAHKFLVKPFRAEELLDCIQGLLDETQAPCATPTI